MRRIALVLAALALATLVAATTAAASFPGRNGAIARGFWSTWDEAFNEADGFERGITLGGRTLYGCAGEVPYGTPDPCADARYSDPAFSPDGRRVVFDAGPTLAIVGSDGAGFRLLSPHAGDDDLPAFSPNGRRIVFSSRSNVTATPHRWDVWISDDDGLGARRLIRDGDLAAWSTRNWIAFVRDGAVFRIRPDGRGLRRIARAASAPAWSPDGTRIAYARRGGVVIARADGSGARRLTGRAAQDGASEIVWSPDGRRLLIQLYDLIEIDLRGNAIRNLGAGEAIGAEYHVERPGFDWQPLPR